MSPTDTQAYGLSINHLVNERDDTEDGFGPFCYGFKLVRIFYSSQLIN